MLKISPIPNFTEIRSLGAELINSDQRTNLTVAFRENAKGPKNLNKWKSSLQEHSKLLNIPACWNPPSLPPCSLSMPKAKSPLFCPISFISSFVKQRKFFVIVCKSGSSSSSMDQTQDTWLPAHITFLVARSSIVSIGASYLQNGGTASQVWKLLCWTVVLYSCCAGEWYCTVVVLESGTVQLLCLTVVLYSCCAGQWYCTVVVLDSGTVQLLCWTVVLYSTHPTEWVTNFLHS